MKFIQKDDMIRNLFTALTFSALLHTTAQTPQSTQRSVDQIDSLMEVNRDLALQKINNALESKRGGISDTLKASLNDKKAEIFRRQGDYSDAVEVLVKNIELKKTLNLQQSLTLSYNALGKCYTSLGNYEDGIKAFVNALEINDKLNDKKAKGFSYNNIAIVYDLQKNYLKALEYYYKSLSIKKELADSAGLATAYNNIAITYFNLNDVERSVDFHKKALELNTLLEREEQRAKSLNNLGFAYIKLNAIPLAISSLKEALRLRLKFDNKKDIATTYNNLAQAFISDSKMDSALIYNMKALQLANNVGALALLRDVYVLKAEIFQKLNKLELAIAYKDSVIFYKDKVINESNIQAVNEVTAKYEFEKLKREAAENNLLMTVKNGMLRDYSYRIKLWSVLSVILILVVILVIIKLRSSKHENLLISAQKLLIENKNTHLERANLNLTAKLNESKYTLEEKSKILDLFYESQTNVELPPELLNLSKRELEVLSYLALGWSDQQIADSLFVARTTVKTHLRRIYSKLLVAGRAEAVTIAHKHKIIGVNL